MPHIMQQHYQMRTKFNYLAAKIQTPQINLELEQVIVTYKNMFHCSGNQAYQRLTRGTS